MASDAVTRRIALEKENRGLLERVAFTWTELNRVSHVERRFGMKLSAEQRKENDRAFGSWLERWAGNRLRDTNNAIVGDHIVIFSRGAVRVGIVVKVGTKNFTVMYVTPTGLQLQRDRGYPAPITQVSVPKGNEHAIRRSTFGL